MKKECEMINDLLPLYIDGVCSEESKKLVEEHMKTCDSCRKTVTKSAVICWAEVIQNKIYPNAGRC